MIDCRTSLLPDNVEGDLHTDAMILNFGPSHPATHGTVRLILTLEGETISKCDVEIGYLHRGFEKEAESGTWNKVFPYTDRLNYVSPLLNNFGFALAVEKLLEIEIPERCKYIRTILGEMHRIADHLTAIGAMGLELGAFTAFLYAIEARELIWDPIEEVTGARMTTSFARIGGLAADLTADFQEKWISKLPHLTKVIDDIDKLLSKNRIFLERMQGTGVISQEDAISYGFTGPCLRATGIDYDIRKDMPYFAYDQVDFVVPLGTTGDNYDRYLVRMEEMRQSISIINQALDKLPDGPYQIDDTQVVLPKKKEVYNSIEGMMSHFKLIFEGVKVPKGEAYGYTEAANGELGFYIVSDGSGQPYRVHVRAPCFYLMGAFDRLIEGGFLADLIPTFDAINMIGGEIDR